jgi:hypothetical protein
MSERGKKIFLAICIILPFLLYCGYYYSLMIRNAPYRFSDFESMTFKYGLGDSLINSYYSKTGAYQYINSRDSLVKDTVRLRKDDLHYLHLKAADLGFWNFPNEISSEDDGSGRKSPRYFIEFKYKEKTKSVLYDVRNTEDPKLNNAAKSLITEISNMINDTRDSDLK